MARPTISMPDSLKHEIDDRRHSTTPRSQWVAEAVVARLNAEDAGEWTDPDPRPEAGDRIGSAQAGE